MQFSWEGGQILVCSYLSAEWWNGDVCGRLYRKAVLSLGKDGSILSRGQIYPL